MVIIITELRITFFEMNKISINSIENFRVHEWYLARGYYSKRTQKKYIYVHRSIVRQNCFDETISKSETMILKTLIQMNISRSPPLYMIQYTLYYVSLVLSFTNHHHGTKYNNLQKKNHNCLYLIDQYYVMVSYN